MNKVAETEGFDVIIEGGAQNEQEDVSQRIILVVEDDRAYANVLHHKLTHEGHHVVIAENGKIGLERLREIKPDLVLLDILLPIKDGFAFLDEVYADEDFQHTSILVHSNLGQRDDIARAKAYENVSGYFVKEEVSVHDVVDRVCQHLAAQFAIV